MFGDCSDGPLGDDTVRRKSGDPS